MALNVGTLFFAQFVAMSAGPEAPAVSLHDSVSPSPITFAEDGMVAIRGALYSRDAGTVLVRVTTSDGQSYVAHVGAKEAAAPLGSRTSQLPFGDASSASGS